MGSFCDQRIKFCPFNFNFNLAEDVGGASFAPFATCTGCSGQLLLFVFVDGIAFTLFGWNRIGSSTNDGNKNGSFSPLAPRSSLNRIAPQKKPEGCDKKCVK